MKPAHTLTVRGTLRALAGAALSAVLVASIGLVSSSAAEPATMPRDDAPSHSMHATMDQRWSQHVQHHLDKLAERLEIKASQEAAWQKFSAAFRDTLRLHAAAAHAAMSASEHGADTDAAMLARQQADRAAEHAQKLAALADATAALRQSLGAEQRLVLDEAARHFAREHGHGGMEAMADGGHHGMMADHCERHERRGDSGMPHGHGEYGEDAHGAAPESAAPQGEAAH